MGKQNLCKRKKWVRQGWEDVSAKETTLIHSFKACGFFVAVDGSEDTEINTMGLNNYCIQLVTGMARMKSVARSYMWWPALDKNMEGLA